MATCQFEGCGKTIDSRAKHAKYCSVNCRVKAHYRRKKTDRKYKNSTLDFWDDLYAIRLGEISKEYENLVRMIAANYSRDLARKVIDSMISLAEDCGKAIELKEMVE